MSKLVVFVGSSSAYEGYFRIVMPQVWPSATIRYVKFSGGTGGPSHADIIVYSYEDSTNNQTRIRGPKVMVCGEPGDVRRKTPDLLLDCKDVARMRAPGVRFGYLPFYVLSFSERFTNVPADLIKKIPFSPITRKTHFCAFLYRQTPKHRTQLFDAVDAYKPVDALGAATGSKPRRTPLAARIDRTDYVVGKYTYNDLAVHKYLPYKFVICCENTLQLPGYITEKMLSAMLAGAIPIYWGSPDVDSHFNSKSFINVSKFASLREAVDEIKRIDTDRAAYEAMLQEPWLVGNKLSHYFDASYLSDVISYASRVTVA